MLKAKLDSVRKNKKGFSLVELIIVVAIMVALIAVLAPSYVKYVTKSRDSALQTAAEDLATAIKTSYADPDRDVTKVPTLTGNETLYITIDTAKKLVISGGSQLTQTICEGIGGIDSAKKMQIGTANLTFKLTINSDGTTVGPLKGTGTGNSWAAKD